MKIHQIAGLFALAFALSGCASIVKGTSQSVAISTPPVVGANCILMNDQGSWSVVTPGAVKLEKSKQDVQISCTKAGYQQAVSTIPSNFQGWTVGNIVFGGIIGLGVDAATGAINEYPKTFAVPMTPEITTPGPVAVSGPPTS